MHVSWRKLPWHGHRLAATVAKLARLNAEWRQLHSSKPSGRPCVCQRGSPHAQTVFSHGRPSLQLGREVGDTWSTWTTGTRPGAQPLLLLPWHEEPCISPRGWAAQRLPHELRGWSQRLPLHGKALHRHDVTGPFTGGLSAFRSLTRVQAVRPRQHVVHAPQIRHHALRILGCSIQPVLSWARPRHRAQRSRSRQITHQSPESLRRNGQNFADFAEPTQNNNEKVCWQPLPWQPGTEPLGSPSSRRGSATKRVKLPGAGCVAKGCARCEKSAMRQCWSEERR